ncbi:MAG: DNA-directed RNA polymerase subunit omega [Nitrospirota bacterium]|nr:DNA-directed RNA polymerase subunit omega [Nitrospirota bacterium]
MNKLAQDIITLPIELNERMADSKFRLVHIASQRVRDLSSGEQPLVVSRSIKDTTVALEESLLGAYKITIGEDAKVAKEELRKRKEQERIEEQLSAKEEEIRKELSAYLTESQAGAEEGEAVEGEAVADAEEEPAAEDTGQEEYSEE